MKFNFKKVVSIFLSMCIFSNSFHTFAMAPLDSGESIDSIIRDA